MGVAEALDRFYSLFTLHFIILHEESRLQNYYED